MKIRKNNAGITLVTLSITIIVLLILSTVAISSGKQAIENSRLTTFTAEMKIMQSEVNILYDKYSNDGSITLENTTYKGSGDIDNNQKGIQDIEDSNINISEYDSIFNAIKENNDGYKVYTKNIIKQLGIDGIERTYLVNVPKRKVISAEGIKYKDKTYYTLEDLPNGLYNVTYSWKENPTIINGMIEEWNNNNVDIGNGLRNQLTENEKNNLKNDGKITLGEKVVLIDNAKGLKTIADEVNNGNNYINKTIYLLNDIYLNGEKISIGTETTAFAGKFNGNNYKIANLYDEYLFGTNTGDIINVKITGKIDLTDGALNIGSIVKDNNGGNIENSTICIDGIKYNNIEYDTLDDLFTNNSQLEQTSTMIEKIITISKKNGNTLKEQIQKDKLLNNNTQDSLKQDGKISLGKIVLIDNAKGFKSMADEVNYSGMNYSGKEVYLIQDIDLSTICREKINGQSVSWVPIGLPGKSIFTGEFNGNNYKISNVYISYAGSCIGLYGMNFGTIKNIKIDGRIKEIDGVDSNSSIGSVVGYNCGIIENCISSVDVFCKYGQTGGIVGASDENSEIINCINKGMVCGVQNVGGIVGATSAKKILNCRNEGEIKHTDVGMWTLGGIAGWIIDGDVENCCNIGNIIGKYQAGGIIGGAKGNINVSNCYNIQEILGSQYIGGIIGRCNTETAILTIENCYSIGKINGINQGAILGNDINGNAQIRNNYYLEGSATGGENGVDTENEVEAKSSDYMKNCEFLSILNKDERLWTIKENVNMGYPIFLWEV